MLQSLAISVILQANVPSIAHDRQLCTATGC